MKNKSPWRRLAGAFFFAIPNVDTSERRGIESLFEFFSALQEVNTFWFLLLCKQTQDTKNFISTNKQREAQKGTKINFLCFSLEYQI